MQSYKRLWYEKNKERLQAQARARYEAKKEEIKAQVKRYKQSNPYKVKACKQKHYEANKQSYIERNRLNAQRRWKTDVHYRLRKLISHRIRMGLKGQARKENDTIELLGCSLEQLKSHIESQFQEGMTWNNQGYRGWHIDHIKPCDAFDLSDPVQQRQCFHYTNLQPLWAKDNFIKRNLF